MEVTETVEDEHIGQGIMVRRGMEVTETVEENTLDRASW